ncbi:MAG: NAD-dependent deacylase [Chitinophagales bacterium]
MKIVILTGAGMSADSGISTFRDSGGLWENHDIMEVASPEGWKANPELVLDFYNKRRRQVLEAQPNPGHSALADLEKYFDVQIITQNVDDLHERAGSKNVLHLHGELLKMRSSGDENLIYECRKDILPGDLCKKGHQLRPHIVWFGEMVPMIEPAAQQAQEADIFAVIGTSLQVYPAAGLINYTAPSIPKFLIDPKTPESAISNFEIIQETAAIGTPKLVQKIIENYG